MCHAAQEKKAIKSHSLSLYKKTSSFVTYAGGGLHCPELVYDVPGEEVDVVVTKRHAGVADPLAHQLVQLAVVQPHQALEAQGDGQWI